MAHEKATVSVCMAAYNGQDHLPEQLGSILSQLPADGELVVVDDASTDGTLAALKEAAADDERIRVLSHDTNRGYVAAFETALRAARGSTLLLSDQDDVWLPEHVPALVSALATHGAVASNLELWPDGAPLRNPVTGRPWRLAHRSGPVSTPIRVLLGMAPYYGCAMGIRREVVRLVVPFPRFLGESHDLWIAICTAVAGQLTHVSTVTVLRRLHPANASAPRPRSVRLAMASRVMLVRCVFVALRRRARSGRR